MPSHTSRALLALGLAAAAAATAAVTLPAGATPPGKNGKLVFERGKFPATDIFTVDADGSGLTRLTGLRGLERDSSWSPNGSKMAFVRGRNPYRGPYDIWAVNADGSGLERLTRHREFEFSFGPAWSPDGGKIAYATDAGGRVHLGLYVMNSDGSGSRRLRIGRSRDYSDPTWSPDGSSIAFANGGFGRDSDSRIAVVDADDGGNLRHLTPRGAPNELNPNWSPDGTQIAFERSRYFAGSARRQADIWLMNADGSGKRRITATRVHETDPVFSPDGTRIAFTSDRDNRRLSHGEGYGRGFELYTMAVDGSDVVRVTTNRRADSFPDWQPLP
jgi:TolB protein